MGVGRGSRDSVATGSPAENVRRSAVADLSSAGLARVLLMVSGLVTGIAIARLYGPDGRGEVSLVTAIYGNAAIVLSLGIDTAAVHLVGRRAESTADIAGAVRRLAGWLGLCAGIASVSITSALSHRFAESSMAIVLGAATAAAPLVAATVLQGHLIGLGRLVEVAWLNALRGPFTLAAVFVAGATDWDASAVLMMYGASEYAVLVATWAVWWRGGVRFTRGSRMVTRRLLKYGLASHLGTVLQGMNYRLDLVLLGALVALSEVGRYSVAVVVVELLWVLPLMLKNFVSQRVAASSGPASNAVALASLKLCVAATAVGAAVLAVVSPLVVPRVFGAEFASSVILIWILLPGALAMALCMNMMNDLVGRGHPRVKSWSALAGCAVTLAVDIPLVPLWGAAGAAIGSTTAYLVTFAVAVPSYRRITNTRMRDWLPASADVKGWSSSSRNRMVKHDRTPTSGS